jgi:hypothetical protein
VKEHNCARFAIENGFPDPILSDYLAPDFIGWQTQTAEGTFGKDLGGNLGDAFAAVEGWGVCPEAFLPYDAANKAHVGNAACVTAARPYRFGTPTTVPINPEALCQVLSSGRVIAIGFEVYESFEETGLDGYVKPVLPGEGLLGGHAVVIVGWFVRNGIRYFIVRNSWSAAWGDGGYCYMPESYLGHLFDAWTTA